MKIPFNRLNFQFSARQINLRFLRFLLKKFFHFINKIACNPNRIKLQLLLNSTISCCDSQSLFEYSEQLPLNCVVLSGQVICLLSLTSLKSQIWITAVERSCAAARNWARRVCGGRTLGCGVAGTRPGPDHPVTSHYQTTKQYRHKCTAAVRPLDHPPILGSPDWQDSRAGVICVTRQFLPPVHWLLTGCPPGRLAWRHSLMLCFPPRSLTRQRDIAANYVGTASSSRTAAAQHNKCVRLQFLQSWLWN